MVCTPSLVAAAAQASASTAGSHLESYSPNGGTSFVVDKSDATTWSILVTNKNKKFEEFRIYGKKNGLPLYVKSRTKNHEVEISGTKLVLREFMKDREVAYVYARNYKNNKYYPMFAKVSPLGVFKNAIADCSGCNTGTGENMLPGGFTQLSCMAQAMDAPAVDCKDPAKATQLNDALKQFSKDYTLSEGMNNGMALCLKKYLPQGNNGSVDSKAPLMNLKSGLSDARQTQSSCSTDSYSSLATDKSVQWGQDLQKVAGAMSTATDADARKGLEKQANDVILHELLHKYIPAFNGSDLCSVTQSTDTEEHLLSSCCSGSDPNSCAQLDKMKADVASLKASIGPISGVTFNDATLMSLTVQKAFYTALKATKDKNSCTADTTGILKSCTLGSASICSKPTESLNNFGNRLMMMSTAGFSTPAIKALTGTSDSGNSITAGDHNTGEIISVTNPIPTTPVVTIYPTGSTASQPDLSSSRSPSSESTSVPTEPPDSILSAQMLADQMAAPTVSTSSGGADVSPVMGPFRDAVTSTYGTIAGLASATPVTSVSAPVMAAAAPVISAGFAGGALALTAQALTGNAAKAASALTDTAAGLGTSTSSTTTEKTVTTTTHDIQVVNAIPTAAVATQQQVDTNVAPTGDGKASTAAAVAPAAPARPVAVDSSLAGSGAAVPSPAAIDSANHVVDSIKTQLSSTNTTTGDVIATLSQPENKAASEAGKVQYLINVENRIIPMGYTGNNPTRIVQYINGQWIDIPLPKK